MVQSVLRVISEKRSAFCAAFAGVSSASGHRGGCKMHCAAREAEATLTEWHPDTLGVWHLHSQYLLLPN